MLSGCCYHPYFTDEESEGQRYVDLLKLSQVGLQELSWTPEPEPHLCPRGQATTVDLGQSVEPVVKGSHLRGTRF